MIQESAKGSLVLLLGQMGATLISALGTIIIARILGSTDYGIVSIAQIPITFTLLFLTNGVGAAITRFLAEARHNDREDEITSIIYAGYLINVGIGLVATLTLYILAGLISDRVYERNELEQLIKILSLSVMGQSLLNTSLAVFSGYERMGKRSLFTIIYSVLKSLLGPALVFIGYGVVGAALGTSLPVLMTGMLAMILVWFISRELSLPRPHSVSQNVSRIIKYAYPLFVSNILYGSVINLLKFNLTLHVSATIIGNFAASTSFSVLLTLFTSPLSTATFPLLSKLKNEDSTLRFVYQNVIKYETILIYPITSIIIALSDHIVDILYGSSYPLTSLYIRILMLQYFFVGLGDITSNNLLNSQGDTQITFRSTLIFFILATPIGLLLIPRFGVIGLQFTIYLIPKISLIYKNWWIKKNYGISINFKEVFKILFSSTISFFLCLITITIIDLHPWLEIFLGGSIFMISYLFLILVTGTLTKENLSHIKILANKNIFLGYLINPIVKIMKKLAK